MPNFYLYDRMPHIPHHGIIWDDQTEPTAVIVRLKIFKFIVNAHAVIKASKEELLDDFDPPVWHQVLLV